MRTLSPTRAAPKRKSNTRRKAADGQRRRRFESALPRFSLVPLLPSSRSISLPRIEWSLPRIRLQWEWLLALLLLLAIGYGLHWTQDDEQFFVYREQVAFENIGYLNAD